MVTQELSARSRTDPRVGSFWIPLCIVLVIQSVLVILVGAIEYDEAIFLDVARNIRRSGLPLRSITETGRYFFDHTPLYVYFLSGMSCLLGENVLAIRLTTVVFALGSVYLIFLIGRDLKGNLAGVVSASLLALNSFFSTYSFFARMEVPMCFFLCLAIYFLARKDDSNRRLSIVAAGLSIAVAVLLKEIALAFWLASAIYVFLTGITWKARLLNAFWILVPTLIALVLWVVWGMMLSPEQFRTNLDRWQGAVSAQGNTAGGRTGTYPGEWLLKVSKEVMGWGSTLLLVIGLVQYVLYRRRHPALVGLLLLYVVIALGVSLIMSLKEPRHVIGLIPSTALLTGLLIDWRALATWARRLRRRLIFVVIAVLLLAWDISPLNFPFTADWGRVENWCDAWFAYRAFEGDRYNAILQEAGEYLANHAPQAKAIAVVHEGPVVGYYADRHYNILYPLTYEQTIKVLGDAEFLVVDHVVFTRQSEEEIQQVLRYIDEQFQVEQAIKDAYRQVIVYRRG